VLDFILYFPSNSLVFNTLRFANRNIYHHATCQPTLDRSRQRCSRSHRNWVHKAGNHGVSNSSATSSYFTS
jgi:hypothetical protein